MCQTGVNCDLSVQCCLEPVWGGGGVTGEDGGEVKGRRFEGLV